MNRKLHAFDPLLNPREDILYTNFVEKFHKLLTDSVSPPYAVSIDGLWGTGKTTVMKSLEKRLKDSGYPVCWFNPWKPPVG
ncbi:MAG: hypothetical protein GY765_05465 [bacterium]|nr:hypothetical protein [bacterium]